MWEVEDALEGRLAIRDASGPPADEEVWIRLPGMSAYHLQKFLEEAAEAGGGFFHTRMAVILWERLRQGRIMNGPTPKAGG